MNEHGKYCHCLKCEQAGTVDTLLNPSVNLIRSIDNRLTAQLSMWATVNMNQIAEDLILRLDGEKGLFYTARFKWSQVNEVEKFFDELGYHVNHIDDREKARKLRELLGEGET